MAGDSGSTLNKHGRSPNRNFRRPENAKWSQDTFPPTQGIGIRRAGRTIGRELSYADVFDIGLDEARRMYYAEP